MALPTLTVLLDDGTSTFPLDVSTKVMALDGYSVSRGRSDWQGAVTAGELSVTFNNSDGYFTVGTGAVFVDQQIKLKETVNGVVYTRFTGYVKSWPTAWPAVVVTFSTVQPLATDAQARAERTTLRSMLEEEILLQSPSAYYTLGEPEGSTTAGDTSGNQAPPLVIAGTGTAPTFGTGTGPVDGSSATQFFAGQYLQSAGTTTYASPSSFTVEAFVTVPADLGIQQSILEMNDSTVKGTSFNRVDFILSSSGAAAFTASHGALNFALAAGSIADGLLHHMVGTYSAGNLELFVDGASVATGSGSVLDAPLTTFFVGAGANVGVTGTVSHVAVYDGVVLTPTQIADRATVGLSTLVESGTARITRLAGYAGIPVGTLDTSLTDVPTQATSGASVFTAIQDVADAEGGLVFINGSGNLTFHNRNRASVKTTPDLTLSSQYVTPDVQPVIDDEQLTNFFEATSTKTGSAQLARDLTSEATHGRYPDSKTYLVQTDQEALDRGNWNVNKLAEPVPRYGTLTINLYGMTASQASTVLAALDLNCWLRVTSMASQTPGGTTADVVVEGWKADVTGESWTITCNVVDQDLFTAGIYNNATLGVYDTSVYAY